MINECGAVGGMRILARKNEELGEIPPQCQPIHHKSQMVRLGIEPGPTWRKADNLISYFVHDNGRSHFIKYSDFLIS
jgi:hypothetical protein